MPAPPAKSKAERRVEVAATRFAAPGAEKVWQSLLAWEEPRRARIWLAQAVHDAARGKERAAATGTAFDTALVVAGFRDRFPEYAASLTADESHAAVVVWQSSGDEYVPGDPAPKWAYLCALAKRLGLGDVSPRAYQDDWEIWTGAGASWAPRAALMQLLGQVEMAALGLNAVTQSENVGAIAGAARVLWSALAYGDETTLRRVRSFVEAWLVAPSPDGARGGERRVPIREVVGQGAGQRRLSGALEQLEVVPCRELERQVLDRPFLREPGAARLHVLDDARSAADRSSAARREVILHGLEIAARLGAMHAR